MDDETLKKYREHNRLKKSYYENYRKRHKQSIRDYCKSHRMIRRFQYLSKAANRRYKDNIITAFDLWKIAKKQKLLCPLTGVKLTNENISIDHITPKSLGGENIPLNIRLVIKQVNAAKQAMTDVAFIELCHRVSATLPLKNFSAGVPPATTEASA